MDRAQTCTAAYPDARFASEDRTQLVWTERDRISLMGPMLNPECGLMPTCWPAVVDSIQRWPERDLGLMRAHKLTIGCRTYWSLSYSETLLELESSPNETRECIALPFVPGRLGRWKEAPPIASMEMVASEVEEYLGDRDITNCNVRFAYIMGMDVSIPAGVESIRWDSTGRPYMVFVPNVDSEIVTRVFLDSLDIVSDVVFPLSTAPLTGNNLFLTCILCYGPRDMTPAMRAGVEVLAKKAIMRYINSGRSFNCYDCRVETRDTPIGPVVVSGSGSLFVSPEEKAELMRKNRLLSTDKVVELAGDSGRERPVVISWRSAWRTRKARRVGFLPMSIRRQTDALSASAAAGRRFMRQYGGTHVTRQLGYSERDVRIWLRRGPYARTGSRGVVFEDEEGASR